mgnify:CR=1 FL=1
MKRTEWLEGPSTPYFRCINESDGITSNMLDCNGIEHARLVQRLNELYQHSLTGLSPTRQERLRKSHEKWTKAYPRECNREPEQKLLEGGTLASVFYSACILTETDARILWLEHRYGSTASQPDQAR